MWCTLSSARFVRVALTFLTLANIVFATGNGHGHGGGGHGHGNDHCRKPRSNLIAKRATGTSKFWLENIKHQGIAPFHPNATEYKVFRNVKDYGAVGDGITDDTAAINAAIKSGGRCGEGTCGSSTTSPAVVYFPAGTYLVSAPIVPYYYTQLVGDATNLPTILAAPTFEGLAVIDANPYLPDGSQFFINQNNFHRSIRNFIIDVRQVPPENSAGTGIHWQVAQATSLANIIFEMSDAPNTAHQGIWMENGSGGFMGDMIFNGGKYGIWGGNQQFTVRNVTMNNVQTGFFSVWNWQWTYQRLRFNNCSIGFEISSGSVAAASIIDAVSTKTSTALIQYSRPSNGTLINSGSLVLNNIKLVDTPVVVQVAAQQPVDDAPPSGDGASTDDTSSTDTATTTTATTTTATTTTATSNSTDTATSTLAATTTSAGNSTDSATSTSASTSTSTPASTSSSSSAPSSTPTPAPRPTVVLPGTILPGPAGSKFIDTWVQGNIYQPSRRGPDENAGQFVQQPIKGPSKARSLLDGQGNIVSRGRPQYDGLDVDDFVSVRTEGAKGDGVTDDTAALQRVLDKYAACKVIYVDAGFYIVTKTLNIPPGTRMVGEGWSVLAGKGPLFQDQNKPKVVFKVGERGSQGVAEFTDIVFTTVGPAAGAIIVEWNIHEPRGSQATTGMWDSHIRIGGTSGTQLEADKCPRDGSGGFDNCFAAFLALHITDRATGYFEGTWIWLSDHDLDLGERQQISIYSGRGVLSESEGPVWMIGTGSEHHVLYQYNLVKARDHYMGLIQTESPYYQPTPNSPHPFRVNKAFHDPEPYQPNPTSAWALNVEKSKNILIFGAGLYSFFDTYTQECIANSTCQAQIANFDKWSEVDLFSLSTVAATYQVSRDGKGVVHESNNENGFVSTVTLWRNSD